MSQRPARWIPLIGIGLSAVLLVWLHPLGRRSRQMKDESSPPVRRVYVSPLVVSLREEYGALPRSIRLGLAEGIRFVDTPERFRKAIRAVIDEQFHDQEDEARSNMAIGKISRGDYEAERAYRQFVAAHLSHYRLSTSGDGYATILYRAPLSGQEVPQRDLRGGPRGICIVR